MSSPKGVKQVKVEDIKTVQDWCEWITMESPGSMKAYEEKEWVVWHCDIRSAAAYWAMKCLANPDCEWSETALQAIIERREEKKLAKVGKD